MRTGTFMLSTTLWPRLASVGARITARMAASQTLMASKISAASSAPSPMVKGRPIASRRSGRSWNRITRRNEMREESVAKTRIKVSVAMSSTTGLSQEISM
jgi:hypothetical protein